MYAGPCILTAVLIAVLACAGCLGPAGPVVNTTPPEPTPEPCETCTVPPKDFCGPPGVCPGGEPVNGIYAFTDRNTYRIGGDVVEFGIVNCGDERKAFGTPQIRG
ncbi:hypothetical protein [Methanoculleus chikugoensis]|uniref:hypothetical protein n=1 Tax=Methanoculleus chikugoensis TaxID=118126 RepID=UPI0006D1BAD7|nr:hypothetical protein [Methanoculleus chikugoensis]